MEYEIEDDEALFDESTNPSLDHRDADKAPAGRASARHADPAEKRKLQKGELIPEEEEHQLA